MSTNTEELDKLRDSVRTELRQVLKLAPADYTENCTNVVMAMIEEHTANAEKQARINELREIPYHPNFIANYIEDRIKELEQS